MNGKNTVLRNSGGLSVHDPLDLVQEYIDELRAVAKSLLDGLEELEDV